MIECGTSQGYNRHVRFREQVCQPCRDAINAYNRLNQNVTVHRRATSVRQRAFVALAKLHPEDYERLRAEAVVQYDQEQADKEQADREWARVFAEIGEGE